MNCNRAELCFSAQYDGGLSASERATFDAHLSSCASCRAAFAQYVRAIADLKKLKPGSTSGRHVADVMARIDLEAARAAPTPSAFPLRRVATHFVAAAVGAAAAFLFLQHAAAPRPEPGIADRESSRDSLVVAPPILAPRLPDLLSRPVRFVGNDTSLERNDQVEAITDGFTMRPGETLRTLPSQRVELTLDETGQLYVKVITTHLPDPPKAVNEMRFVELPPLVSVDRQLVDNAVDALQTSVSDQLKDLDVSSSVRSLVARFESSVAAAQAAGALTVSPEAVPAQGNAGEPSHAPPGAFAAATFIASDVPVTISRSGDRSALSVQGSVARIIPELIGLLDNEDGEIADLAAAKLDFLRHDLEADPRIGKKLFAFPPETERVPREHGSSTLSELLTDGFGRFGRFGQDDTVERKLTPAERWRLWWQSNAVLIATGSSSAT